METLLQFAKINKTNKVVIVEVMGENDGTPKLLRRTTLNPTPQIKNFRQDIHIDDDEELFKKNMQDEIAYLDANSQMLKNLLKLHDHHKKESGKLTYTAVLLGKRK